MRPGLLFVWSMFFFSYVGYSQPNPVEKAAEAFGCLAGRNYALNQIEKGNPGLAFKAKLIRTLLNATFAQAEKNVEEYLLMNLGEEQFKVLKNKVSKLSQEGKLPLRYTDEEALDVITACEGMLVRRVPSSELTTLLIFQYKDNPAGIYSDGFTSVFRTIGRAKAKDTDWQIRVPLGWEARGADRFDFIQEFSPPFLLDDVYPSIIMQVMEWSGRKSMKEFAKELIEEVAGIPNFRPVGYKPVTIQGHPGLVFCSENVISIEGEKIKERMIAYIFAYRYRFYILIGVLGCIDAEKNLKIEMEKYEPMFKQAVNSIVVYDK